MKKILALIIVALVVPSIALAGNKPTDPPGQSKDTHGNSQSAIHSQSDTHSKAPHVLYVFKGVITDMNIASTTTTVTGPSFLTSTGSFTLNNYTCDNGTVTLKVNRVNHKRVFKALMDANANPGLTLTLCLNAKTKVIVKGSGKVDLANAIGDTTYNNYGMVKVRYALKGFDPATAAGLQDFLSNAAEQVIVKKALPTG